MQNAEDCENETDGPFLDDDVLLEIEAYNQPRRRSTLQACGPLRSAAADVCCDTSLSESVGSQKGVYSGIPLTNGRKQSRFLSRAWLKAVHKLGYTVACVQSSTSAGGSPELCMCPRDSSDGSSLKADLRLSNLSTVARMLRTQASGRLQEHMLAVMVAAVDCIRELDESVTVQFIDPFVVPPLADASTDSLPICARFDVYPISQRLTVGSVLILEAVNVCMGNVFVDTEDIVRVYTNSAPTETENECEWVAAITFSTDIQKQLAKYYSIRTEAFKVTDTPKRRSKTRAMPTTSKKGSAVLFDNSLQCDSTCETADGKEEDGANDSDAPLCEKKWGIVETIEAKRKRETGESVSHSAVDEEMEEAGAGHREVVGKGPVTVTADGSAHKPSSKTRLLSDAFVFEKETAACKPQPSGDVFTQMFGSKSSTTTREIWTTEEWM